jgi:hypothetical protein
VDGDDGLTSKRGNDADLPLRESFDVISSQANHPNDVAVMH